LQQQLLSTGSYNDIIGESDILKHMLYRVEQVAPMDTTVLLEGETGTGKELFVTDKKKSFGLLQAILFFWGYLSCVRTWPTGFLVED
jgi:transcriptional regulator of acetoin/glycerol metabolism